MRRSLILLLAIVALAAPGGVLAADPTTVAPVPPPVVRAFEITGIVLGDQKLAVSGKLQLDGTHLNASVGCNSIGGDVTIVGDVLTAGQLMTTEMACQGSLGEADTALMKVLASGPLTMTADQWSGANGALLVRDAGLAPEPVPSGAPSDIVVSPPDDTLVGLSITDCVGILPADEMPGAGGASGSGSGSSSGSGGGTTGTGATEPGSAGGVGPGTEPVPIPVPIGSAGAVDGGPAPVGTTGTDPAPPPAATDVAPGLPIGTAIAPAPPVDPTVTADPGQSPAFVPTPVPGGIGPGPTHRTPTLDDCRALVARLVAPTAVGNAGGPATTANEAAMALDKSAVDAGTVPVAAVGAGVVLVLVVLGAVAFGLRRRTRRAGTEDAG